MMDYRTMYDEVGPIGRRIALPRESAPLPPLRRPVGRRVFLGMLGAGAASLVGGHALGAVLNPAAIFLPSSGFRIYTVAPMPDFHPATYRLTIGGKVSSPQSLSYHALLALPHLRAIHTYHCVTGWIVDKVHWEGMPLRRLIDLVQPAGTARFINFWSADGAYTESVTIEQALAPDVMLGYRMNGKPLSKDQGAPVRLVIPQMYGYKYIKWVNRLEFADEPLQGYWEARGYPTDAYIGRV
jgi:DMSO/TMAO reductase YedYZ molybdopterin-dependent catalytic subunit